MIQYSFLWCLCVLVSWSCQHRILKNEKTNTAHDQPVKDQLTSPPVVDSAPVEGHQSPSSVPMVADYAVILGPGSSRTFAHAGVVRELNRAGVSIKWIVGLEKASLPAFLYAENPDPFQVEWAFFKWKDLNIESKDEVLNQVKKQFKLHKIDQFKISSACASYSALQGKAYLYQKGDLLSALEMCYFAHNQNPKALAHAHAMYLRPLIQRAYQQGLKVIYIDVLSDIRTISENTEQIYLWGLWKEAISLQLEAFPDVQIIKPKLQGPIENVTLRTNWIKKGAEATQQWLMSYPVTNNK